MWMVSQRYGIDLEIKQSWQIIFNKDMFGNMYSMSSR